MSIIMLICCIALFWSGIKVTNSNPTDTYIKIFRECIRNNENFREEYTNFCPLCTSPVRDNSKHCMICNRCVNDFDHHCTWINNCISSLNYKNFIILISSVEALLLITTCSGMKFSVDYFKYEDNYREKFKSLYGSENYHISIGFVLASTISSVFAFCFNTYLICFHIWIKTKGITTYEYIIKIKKNKVSAERTVERSNDPEMHSLNKIQPEVHADSNLQ